MSLTKLSLGGLNLKKDNLNSFKFVTVTLLRSTIFIVRMVPFSYPFQDPNRKTRTQSDYYRLFSQFKLFSNYFLFASTLDIHLTKSPFLGEHSSEVPTEPEGGGDLGRAQTLLPPQEGSH